LELETEAVDSMENLLKENLLLEVKGLGRCRYEEAPAGGVPIVRLS
jgi:hypothetical protein